MPTLRTSKELESRLGQEIGVSDWHLATQEDIDELALAPVLMDEVVSLQSFAFVVNARVDRIRFPDMTFLLCFECPSQNEPVCLAESVVGMFETC